MPYESKISFTLDTICPWTFLALRRLQKALLQIRATKPSTTFHLYINHYQLHPNFPLEGKDKYAWYLSEIYDGDEERMKKYVALMTAYGIAEGIHFDFKKGKIANTFEAHRVIQYVQSHQHSEDEVEGATGEGKETQAFLVLESLYRQYFEEGRHPSSEVTLIRACEDAGVDVEEAKRIVKDRETGRREVEREIEEQKGNGVDAVPYIIVEGKKRDFTIVGLKEAQEYVKFLEQVVRESS